MKQTDYKKLFMKHMRKDLLEKMLVEVVMTLMYMFIQEQVHIYVERNQHLLKVLKVNQEDLDLSHPFQLMQVSMDAQPQYQMLKLLLCVLL